MASINPTEDKNPNQVAGGLKAAIKNPNVSEEAKERAEQRLHEMGTSANSSAKPTDTGEHVKEGPNPGNVLGGYKATLKNPRVSEEAKEHAEQVLRENGAI